MSKPATSNDQVCAGSGLLRDGDEESKLDPISHKQVFAPKIQDKIITPNQSAPKAKSSSVLSKRKHGDIANAIEPKQVDAADCQSEYFPKFRQPKAPSLTQKP